MDYLQDGGRVLPQAIEAEKALIGVLIMNSLQIGAGCAARGLSASAFHGPANATVYECAMELWADQKPADIITVAGALKTKGQLQEVGGHSGVADYIGSSCGVASAFDSYIDTILEKKVLRDVIHTCSRFEAMARTDNTEDVPGFISDLSGEIAALAAAKQKEARTMKVLLTQKAHRMHEDSPVDNTVSTGLSKLDSESPLKAGDMPVIAGEAKAGKSILALSIGAHIAVKVKRPVLYFSLEDSAEQPIDRILASMSRVPVAKHHVRIAGEQEFSAVERAIRDLAASGMVIRDDVYDLDSIVAVTRQFVIKHPNAGAIIVDYAQLVRAQTRKQDSREQEIAKISRTLRLLALELQVPIIVLSQLNKDGETRESKALENDMTALWKICIVGEEQNIRYLSIPRQRNGASGIGFNVTFHGRISRVEDFIGEEPDEQSQEPAKAKGKSTGRRY